VFEKEDFKFLASFENEQQGIEKTLSGIFYGTRASPDSQRAAGFRSSESRKRIREIPHLIEIF